MEYPIHDKDGYLEFVLGLWFHTRHLVGKPTIREIDETLPDWPLSRRGDLFRILARNGQVIIFPEIALT